MSSVLLRTFCSSHLYVSFTDTFARCLCLLCNVVFISILVQCVSSAILHYKTGHLAQLQLHVCMRSRTLHFETKTETDIIQVLILYHVDNFGIRPIRFK